MCQHRDKKTNFCKEKNKDCTSTDTDFSKCDSYLVADRLSMFQKGNKDIMIERLSGEYNRGYTQAIQDITEVFEYIQPDLKHHHKNLNGKLSVALLSTILDNRVKIREKRNGFIRWNCIKKEFEWFSKKKGDVNG